MAWSRAWMNVAYLACFGWTHKRMPLTRNGAIVSVHTRRVFWNSSSGHGIYFKLPLASVPQRMKAIVTGCQCRRDWCTIKVPIVHRIIKPSHKYLSAFVPCDLKPHDELRYSFSCPRTWTFPGPRQCTLRLSKYTLDCRQHDRSRARGVPLACSCCGYHRAWTNIHCCG